MGFRDDTINTVDISLFQYVDDGFKMITATREVTKFNKAIKNIDECDGLVESLLPNLVACLQKFKERLSLQSPSQMKTWYRICNNAKMSTGQWLAQYAAKEFEDALSEAHAFSTSEGVQPLMQTVTLADLQDNSAHQQIMHLTHSNDSRNFYKQNRRINLLVASCDAELFRTATSSAPQDVTEKIKQCIQIAKEKAPAYSKIISTMAVSQACFRGLRAGETRRSLVTKALSTFGDAEIPPNLLMMSKTLIADEDEPSKQ